MSRRGPNGGLVVVLALVLAIPPGLTSSSPTPLVSEKFDAFQVALDALDHGGAARMPALRAQRANVEGARSLLDALPTLQGDSLHRAAALAELAETVQYDSLGIAYETRTAATHANPSDAALALLARRGITPSAQNKASLARLDTLPGPVLVAMKRVLDSYLAFEAASEAAFAHADQAKLEAARALADSVLLGQRPSPSSLQGLPTLDDFGIDWGMIPPARDALLDAAVALHDALEAVPAPQLEALTPIDVPGVLHIDLTSADNVYTQDYALLIDVGGSDTYLNNAGGNSVGGCTGFQGNGKAAALIDLGGDDSFGGDGRVCGSNGGGAGGAGFLLAAGGRDRFTGGSNHYGGYMFGGNGGGYEGSGFMVVVNGDDSYTASGVANGGGEAGIGFLLDFSGNDDYVNALNGGALVGAGALIDVGGDDYYSTSGAGNGGAELPGRGFLLDAGGDDTYLAYCCGANGGGSDLGIGFLLDSTGNDTYTALGGVGANGGAQYLGLGTLLDLGGNDRYATGNDGGNGGVDRGLFGLLVDSQGDDTYTAGWSGNGNSRLDCALPFFLICLAYVTGSAALIDGGGHDSYQDVEGGRVTSCVDCSVIPKGTLGVQVDLPD